MIKINYNNTYYNIFSHSVQIECLDIHHWAYEFFKFNLNERKDAYKSKKDQHQIYFKFILIDIFKIYSEILFPRISKNSKENWKNRNIKGDIILYKSMLSFSIYNLFIFYKIICFIFYL